MSVTLQKVVFHNRSGLEIPLIVQAPIDRVVYGPKTVGAGTKITIDVRQDNCQSARLIVDDSAHGATQDFILSATELGRALYLESIEADFSIANINGSAIARTS